MSSSPPSPGLSERLTLLIDHLCRVVAAHAGRNRSAAPVVLLLWRYLRRLARRFNSLETRLRENRLPPPSAPRKSPRERGPGGKTLPQGFAWVIRMAQETASFGSQLRHLLSDPEVAAMLAAAPQAGRMLRPLCRMLGVRPGPGLPKDLFPPRPASDPPTPRSPPPPEPTLPSLAAESPARIAGALFGPARRPEPA